MHSEAPLMGFDHHEELLLALVALLTPWLAVLGLVA